MLPAAYAPPHMFRNATAACSWPAVPPPQARPPEVIGTSHLLQSSAAYSNGGTSRRVLPCTTVRLHNTRCRHQTYLRTGLHPTPPPQLQSRALAGAMRPRTGLSPAPAHSRLHSCARRLGHPPTPGAFNAWLASRTLLSLSRPQARSVVPQATRSKRRESINPSHPFPRAGPPTPFPLLPLESAAPRRPTPRGGGEAPAAVPGGEGRGRARRLRSLLRASLWQRLERRLRRAPRGASGSRRSRRRRRAVDRGPPCGHLVCVIWGS